MYSTGSTYLRSSNQNKRAMSQLHNPAQQLMQYALKWVSDKTCHICCRHKTTTRFDIFLPTTIISNETMQYLDGFSSFFFRSHLIPTQKMCAWLVWYGPRIAVRVAKVAFQVMDGRPRVPHHAEPSHRIIYNISNTISYCTWLSGVMASSEMTMMQIGKIRKSRKFGFPYRY